MALIQYEHTCNTIPPYIFNEFKFCVLMCPEMLMFLQMSNETMQLNTKPFGVHTFTRYISPRQL